MDQHLVGLTTGIGDRLALATGPCNAGTESETLASTDRAANSSQNGLPLNIVQCVHDEHTD